MTDPGAPPLNLKEIEARHVRYRAGNFGGEEAHAALVDVAALLRALRETRAALASAEYWMGWRPMTNVRMDQCERAYRQVRDVLGRVDD